MSLIHIIQGLLHADWAAEYGLDATKLSVTARKTLPNHPKGGTNGRVRLGIDHRAIARNP